MKKRITLIAAGLFLSLLSTHAQTTCSDDRNAYVDSKNVGTTGAYTLTIGAEEKASQTYHYSGPGKVGGARVYGTVPLGLGVKLRVSLYNVDANGRPTGTALATAPIQNFYAWSPAFFDVSFSPAVSVNSNFAMVVEIVNVPGWGRDFALRYTGNGEGNAEDLASLAGTSTGFNWASAMSTYNKDGDFYIYPRMINFNTPIFSLASTCVNTGASLSFVNNTQMTKDPMFNRIAAAGYSGTNNLYTWDFGDGTAVSHLTNPTHAYATAGVYTITLTSMIEGWSGNCIKTYTKVVSVGLAVNATAVTNVTCNGSNNGSIIAVGSGGSTPYTYSLNNNTYQSSANFTGLIAQVYNLYVKDAHGCIQTTSFIINQPVVIHFTSASSTNASCGNADGGILVASSGGLPPMQYKCNSGTYQSSGTFSGLTAGAYTITAKDANGCTYSTIVVVSNSSGPAFSVTNSTNVSCNGGSDGSISLTSSGGTGTVQYSINGGTTYQANGTFTNVTAGTYTAIVKDAAGCTDIRIFHITEPQTIRFTASTKDLTCNGSANGEINVTTTTGGTGSVVYSLDNISYQSGTNFLGLTAGTYTVYARDIAGCVSNILATLYQPTSVSATVTPTSAACNGNQDGTLTITGSGGTSGYEYGIGTDGEYQSTGIFSNLAAGTYPLVVIDANGCIFKTTGTITQPSVIVPVATSTNSTCSNSNGGIMVTATGGSGSGYTYSINGGTFGVGTFSSLGAGTYVVTAKDGTGCTSTINASVFDSNGPSILSSNHTNVNCNGGSDGTITVGTVSGGTGTLQYSINGTAYQTSTVFSGLPAGVYNVTVKDAVGCIGNVTETLTEPNAFVITTNVVNATCNASNTGSVALQVGGGAGTLAYSINGGTTYQSSSTFSNLGAGTYGVLVKDAGGCFGYVLATVTEPPVISVNYNTLNITCHGANDGSITVTASGGTGALKYSLDGVIYQTSNLFTNLFGGSYIVYVKDASGCIKTIPVNLYEPTALTVTANASDVTCYGGNNAAIALSVTGGTSNYYFSWSNEVSTQNNFNLTAGTYTVVVHDGNNCISTNNYTITQPSSPVIVNGTVVNSTGTNNGAVNIAVTGGGGTYTFLWSNNATTENVSGLAPGVYSVIVTDANGCSASSTFLITNTAGIATYDALSDQVSVYPNPANDYVIVEVDGFRIDKVEVYDVLGQVAFKGEFNNSKVEINTAGLNQGVYFVKVLVDEKLITKKVRITK